MTAQSRLIDFRHVVQLPHEPLIGGHKLGYSVFLQRKFLHTLIACGLS